MTAQSQDGGAFERSLAELSRRLNERSLAFSPEQARAAAQARRAALQERDRARRPWLAVLFGAPLAAAIGVAAAWVIQPVDTPEASDAPLVAPLISTEARAEPPPPEAPSSPPPPASVVPAPEPSPSATASEPAAVADTPAASAPQTAPSSEAALPVIDVREVQAKLRAFGFEPGPVDGVTGRQTEAAVRRYQQSRSQPQTGKVDQELLDQLRRDPAPQVARHVAPRPAAADNRTVGPAVGPTVAAPARPQRQADPFEPVRSAGDRFGRWLESLVR